jgi:hypothetical protein
VHDADPAHRVPTEPVPHDQTDDLQVPEGAEERSRWLLAGARRLGDAVREAGPQTGGWTWADDKTAGFWLRRITHDTLVHRLDAELAVGRESPWLRTWPPTASPTCWRCSRSCRGSTTSRPWPGYAAAASCCTSMPPTRALALPVNGWPAARRQVWCGSTDTARADAALRGRALDLLLVLSRRAPLDGSQLEASGDPELLAHWLEHSRLDPA